MLKTFLKKPTDFARKDTSSPPEWVTALLLVISVIILNLAYRLLVFPPESEWFSLSLIMAPETSKTVQNMWDNNFWALFAPFDMGGGRYNWSPCMTIPMHLLWSSFAPKTVYLIITSLQVGTMSLVSLSLTRSVLFASLLGILAALSTTLHYGFVFGNVASLHLFMTYVAVVVFVSVKYFRSGEDKFWFFTFCFAWIFLALSFEFWVNLAVPAIVCAAFIYAWAGKHQNLTLQTSSKRGGLYIATLASIYLVIRLQFAQHHSAPGHESEMVFTYKSTILMYEDMFVNYLSLLHMSFTSLLPGFTTFSPSYTYIGPGAIIEAQNGYHSTHTNLVAASHLTSWRFLAGIYATLLFIAGWHWIKSAWRSSDPENLVAVCLFLVIILGFATYVPVKMRPMNITPMLSYKSVMSATAFMALAVWITCQAHNRFTARSFKRGVVALLVISATVSAFTRPASQIAGLEAIGLGGLGDPFGRVSDPGKALQF